MDKKSFLKHYCTEEEDLTVLIEEAKDFAMHKNIAMQNVNWHNDIRIHLPFTLVPTEFPRQSFELVYDIQPHLNYVLHKISFSKEVLSDCLSSTIEADDFISKIYDIFKQVIDSQLETPSLGLLRSDYLLNCGKNGTTNSIKQVENNTIAAGFCGIAPGIRDLYIFLLRRLGWTEFEDKLPQNDTCTETVKGMFSAWQFYNKANSVILFVVEEITFNICDQRSLEFKLLELDRNIVVIRRTFKQLRCSLVAENSRIFVDNKEVAVVYYRVGYSPKHYEEEDWKTRLLIEQSCAIKCPSAGFHLAGTKKIQSYLTKEGVLEKFVKPEIAQQLRQVFANQYLLSMVERDNVHLLKVFSNLESYVLKAEREGGGNNLYNSDIKGFFENSSPDDRKQYILMDRIKPPELLNCIIQSNKDPIFCPVTSELGIFGVIFGHKDKIFKNYSAGYILRSKPTYINEVGLASGYGALDYPYLI